MDSIFFILSKVAWAILSPSNLLLFTFIIGTLFLLVGWKKIAKKLLITASLFAALIVSFPAGDWLIHPLEKQFSQPKTLPSNIDGIIVLGGGEDLPRYLSWPDNQINTELGLGGDRFIAAKYLTNHYPNTPLIFTGGSGSIKYQDHLKEGNMASSLFTTLEINNPIIIEDQSRNTYENFKNSLTLLPTIRGKYLLVTSAFHMPRSVGIARKFGLEVIPFPVDYRSQQPESRNLDFDFYDHLKSLEPAWKEWIGLSVYYLTGKTSSFLPE